MVANVFLVATVPLIVKWVLTFVITPREDKISSEHPVSVVASAQQYVPEVF